MYCRECGKQHPSGDKYCKSCGAPTGFTGEAPQAATPEPKKKRFLTSPAGIVLIIILALLVVGGITAGVLYIARSDGGSTSGETEEEIDLGEAYAEFPDPESLIQTDTWGEIPANQVCVLLEEGKGLQDAELVARELSGTVVGEIEYISCYQIETDGVTEEDLTDALAVAEGLDGVEASFPNAQVFSEDTIEGKQVTPLNEKPYIRFYPGYNLSSGYYYEIIGLQEGWDMVIGARAIGIDGTVRAGILDSGLFRNSIDYQFCSEEEEPPKDKAKVVALEPTAKSRYDYEHGTGVAQVFFASCEYSGIAGVAGPLGGNLVVSSINRTRRDAWTESPESDPEDLTIYESQGKSWTLNTLVDQVTIVESGAKVINNSWGMRKPDSCWRNQALAWRRFYKKMARPEEHPDVLFVFAAGNENGALDGENDVCGYKLPNVITVGGIDHEGNKWIIEVDGTIYRGTNYSTGEGEVTLAAPAKGICISYRPPSQPDYRGTGTSYAAPMVSGAAALIKSINPALTAEQIKEMLISTAATSVTQGSKTTNVPSDIGGRVLRVDNAVYEAVKSTGKKISREDLLALGRVNLKAEGGPEEYEVTAGVEVVGDKPVTLKIELEGEGEIEGSAEKTLEKPGEVTWKITKADEKDPLKLKVTRLDSRAASRISESLSLRAEGGPSEYQVTAAVKGVGEAPVKLKIEIKGKGSVEGDAEKSLAEDGEVTWKVTKEKASETVTVKVTMWDTGEAAIVTLEPSKAKWKYECEVCGTVEYWPEENASSKWCINCGHVVIPTLVDE
jgi:hypothetical protein